MHSWQEKVQSYWYQEKPCLWLKLLQPLAILYCLIVTVRKFLYQYRILTSVSLKVPTIVVGNITVGGTGKTPVVIYLVKLLIAQGFKPGVISRGYKGSSKQNTIVMSHSDPLQVGDEPVLIAKRTKCPVVVGKNRVAAGKYLCNNFPVDVIISDDGLQHYALERDVEIIVIDGDRKFGNGYCLPMGPLRELPTRLSKADLLLVNGGPALPGAYEIVLSSGRVYNLQQHDFSRALVELAKTKVHAIAGIGNADKFFHYLNTKGLAIIAHSFPDHHNFTRKDLVFKDNYPIVMTEKDAIKCQEFAKENYWFLPIEIKLPLDFEHAFLLLINKVKNVR